MSKKSDGICSGTITPVSGGNGLERNPICFKSLGTEELKMYNPFSAKAKSKEPEDFRVFIKASVVIAPTLRG
jgi:hypothetical protein